MPSGNLPAQTALAVPEDTMLLYTVISPFGITDDRKITADDLLATITAAITDKSLQFDDGLGVATVSAAGMGKLIYNDTAKKFQVSVDGGVYTDIGGGGSGSPGGANKQVQFNNAATFGGAAGFEYQAGASPNITIEAQSGAHVGLAISTFNGVPSQPLVQFIGVIGDGLIEFDPEDNANTTTGDMISLWANVNGVNAGMGIWSQNAGSAAYLNIYADTTQDRNVEFRVNPSGASGGGVENTPNASTIHTSSSLTAGLFLITGAVAPIIFYTGGAVAVTNERARITTGLNRQIVVTAVAATPRAVTTIESDNVFTNEGAGAQIEFTLPVAAANLIYTWIVQDADGIKITAAGGDTIRFGGTVTGAGGNITSTTIGSTITLIAINATEWMATSVVGTWA